ncbi:MAG: transposase [Oligoflexus sp.]
MDLLRPALAFAPFFSHWPASVCLALGLAVMFLVRRSSYFLRKEFWPLIRTKLWGKQLWSHSYCALTCGGAPLEILKQYVDNQRTPPSADAVRQSKQERGKRRVWKT